MVDFRTLTAGDSFGELALLTDQPRAASIYCTKSATFATLDK
jgi:CRP-like cAMP-binding protein